LRNVAHLRHLHHYFLAPFPYADFYLFALLIALRLVLEANEEEARRNEEQARRNEEQAMKNAAEERGRRLVLEAELREMKEILNGRRNT